MQKCCNIIFNTNTLYQHRIICSIFFQLTHIICLPGHFIWTYLCLLYHKHDTLAVITKHKLTVYICTWRSNGAKGSEASPRPLLDKHQLMDEGTICVSAYVMVWLQVVPSRFSNLQTSYGRDGWSEEFPKSLPTEWIVEVVVGYLHGFKLYSSKCDPWTRFFCRNRTGLS